MRQLHPLLAHPSLRSAFSMIACLGLISAAAGYWANHDRFWANLLLSGFFILCISLGTLVFLAIQSATASSWSKPFQKITESLSSGLWAGIILVAAAVGLGGHSLYGWVHGGVHAPHSQELWLSPPFQLARLAGTAALWLFLGFGLLSRLRAEREHAADPEQHRGFAGIYLAAFAFSFTLAGMDWIMSLEPLWFSTIFSLYLFGGAFLSGLAATAVMLTVLRRVDAVTRVVDSSVYHDLGKLLFGFSSFWAYLWFCQFLLIWYSNLPEETSFFAVRASGSWGLLSALAVATNWVVPFLALMTARSKMDPQRLFRVGLCVLFGRWLDLYVLIMPRFLPQGPDLSGWEIGVFIGAAALLSWAVLGYWDDDGPVDAPRMTNHA